MLGWQVIWGAAFVKLFGYNYNATRISTMVLSAVCIWLMHAILCRCGVNRRNAIFGALVLGFSPIFVPLSITFMSDIPGLFVVLLCMYFCLRAMHTKSDGSALAYLVAAALSGIAGGTARQIAWMAPLTMVPATGWLLRKRKPLFVVGMVCIPLTILVALISVHWFYQQPFSIREPLLPRQGYRRMIIKNYAASLLCMAFLAVPILAAWLVRIRKIPAKAIALLVLASAALTVGARFLTEEVQANGLAPWSGDVILRIGMQVHDTGDLVGTPPVSIGSEARAVISLLVVFSLAIFAYCMWKQKPPAEMHEEGGLSWRALLWLMLPFVLAYSLLLEPRSYWGLVFDRYTLPLFAIAIIVLLRLFQERVGDRIPAVSYIALALMAVLSIAGTHDWMALNRARVQAVSTMMAAGISRSQIQVNLDMDGEVQIANAGAINDYRIQQRPPGFVTMRFRPSGLPDNCVTLFNFYVPTIHAEYFLTFRPAACLAPSQFGEVDYHTWMPPFTRHLRIDKLHYPGHP